MTTSIEIKCCVTQLECCVGHDESILGEPGALSVGEKKSKRVRKKIGHRKVKNKNRSPWDSSLNPFPAKGFPIDE